MSYKKVDANQTEVVEALRKCGFSVAVTSSLGKGFPDLVVGKNYKNVLVELKDGNKSASKRRLTQDEERFFNEWRGIVVVANNIDDIIKAFDVN